MRRYSQGYETLRHVNDRALYPEREMWRHLHAAGLQVIAMRNFKSSLVRSDQKGRLYQEDAYTKLRKDFPDLALLAMPPPVTAAICGNKPPFRHQEAAVA